MNRAWENKEYLGLYELKQHKPWFDEECSRLLDHRKQDKLQRLQDPSQSNTDNLYNVTPEASRNFRKNKNILTLKLKYLKPAVR